MNYQKTLLIILCCIQSYRYKPAFGKFVAIAQLVGWSTLDEQLDFFFSTQDPSNTLAFFFFSF